MNAREARKDGRLPEARKGAPDLVLEDHDNGEYEVRKNIGQHPCDGLEMCPSREIEKQDNHAEADHHLDRPCTFDEDEDLINQKRKDENVEQRVPVQRPRCEKVKHSSLCRWNRRS